MNTSDSIGEAIEVWIKKTKKSPCTNCGKKDFGLSDKFGIIYQIDFDEPQTIDKSPDQFQRFITIICNNCGKSDLYDARIAGFAKKIEK